MLFDTLHLLVVTHGWKPSPGIRKTHMSSVMFSGCVQCDLRKDFGSQGRSPEIFKAYLKGILISFLASNNGNNLSFCISPTVSLQTSPELGALQQYLLEGPQELSTAKLFLFFFYHRRSLLEGTGQQQTPGTCHEKGEFNSGALNHNK